VISQVSLPYAGNRINQHKLDFLTEEEKQMILYKNAKVFLGTMDITSGNKNKK
jgi:hypothetical protein